MGGRDMFETLVEFAPSALLRADVYGIRRTNLHCHGSAVEIVYVLRGELEVTVSCEHFDLAAGDFVVINRADPHQLLGSPHNVTDVEHIIFA